MPGRVIKKLHSRRSICRGVVTNYSKPLETSPPNSMPVQLIQLQGAAIVDLNWVVATGGGPAFLASTALCGRASPVCSLKLQTRHGVEHVPERANCSPCAEVP